MVKITFEGTVFKCSTPDEAVRLLRQLRHDNPDTGEWTPESFWRFIGSLRIAQQSVLRHLTTEGPRTDQQLRVFLELDTNQQLAGVLSGISKQAAAHGISARSVFKIEKESKSRTITKTYRLDPGFEIMAKAAIESKRDGQERGPARS